MIPGLFAIFAVLYFLILRKWASSVPIEDNDDEEDEMDMNKDGKMDWLGEVWRVGHLSYTANFSNQAFIFKSHSHARNDPWSVSVSVECYYLLAFKPLYVRLASVFKELKKFN